MKENLSEDTPLQLYRKAYELQYTERKMAPACEVYGQIIREFPDSDVSAYAAIQMQKIRAGKVARTLGRGRTDLSLALLLIVLNFAALTALAIIGSLYILKTDARVKQYRIIHSAAAKMFSGRNAEALEMLKMAKLSDPSDATPFVLSAEIYRKNREYAKARSEYENYSHVYGADSAVDVELERIKQDEKDFTLMTRKEREAEKLRIEEEEEKITEEIEKTVPEKKAAPKAQVKPLPVKPKPKIKIASDSISFF
jgi:hypothetical protein